VVFLADGRGAPLGRHLLPDRPRLTLPYPLARVQELVLQVGHYGVGFALFHLRLATEALGLGGWIFCGFSENLVLGALPEIGKGLGFHYNELADGRRFPAGLEGVFEGYGMPAPWWDSVDHLVDTVVNYRYNKDGVFFGG